MAFDRRTAQVISTSVANPIQQTRSPSVLQRAQQGAQRVEEQLKTRPSSIQFLRGAIRDPQRVQQHPFQTGLAVAGAPFEAAESVAANVGLGIQQRRGVGQTVRDVVAGLRGERPAQLGDVARASGLPVISSEPVASTLGFTAAVSPALLTRVGQQVASGVSRGLTAPGRNLRNLSTFGGRKRLGDRVMAAADEAEHALGTKFGQEIDALSSKYASDPSKRLDLQEAVERFRERTGGRVPESARPEATALLRIVLEDPSQAKNLTIQDAQLLKTAVRSIPQVQKSVKQDIVSAELVRASREFSNRVRHAEVQAVPELAQKFESFKQAMDAKRLIDPYLRPGRISSEIFSPQGKLLKDPHTRIALREFLRHVPGTKASLGGRRHPFSEVLGAARAGGVARTASTVAKIGAGVGIAGLVGRYFLKPVTGGEASD